MNIVQMIHPIQHDREVHGPLVGLELGPETLNLIRARHGAVLVAEAIRNNVAKQKNKVVVHKEYIACNKLVYVGAVTSPCSGDMLQW